MLGERLDQPHQLVAREIPAAVIFGIPLDPLDRIRLAHVPANGEREHLAEHRHSAVCLIRTTDSGDLAVESVDVPESDVGDLDVLAEVRLDVYPQEAFVVLDGART